MMYPLALNKMFIFSYKSTKIQFCLLLEMEIELAVEDMVVGEKRLKLDDSFLTSRREDFVQTTSEAMRGLIKDVFVS